MNIRKIASFLFIYAAIAFSIPAFAQDYDSSDSGINSGSAGLHLRAAMGTGQVAWGYIPSSKSSGDLGSGSGSNINLAAMFNFTLVGFEFNYLGGDINDLEWTQEVAGVNVDYKSTGSGNYNVYDWKLGGKLFTEPGDMGYTFIYMGKRYWNTERKQDTLESDLGDITVNIEYKAKGDGWIYGIRDFSTLDLGSSFGIIIQSGLFLGSAPLTSFKENGTKIDLPKKGDSLSLGFELGAGVALTDIGLSFVGGVRIDSNVTTFNESVPPSGDDSIFGFGSTVFFIEAGMMF